MSAPCGRLDDERQLAYWLDEDAVDDATEEHILSCAHCSRRLQDLAELGQGITRLAREGGVTTVVTPAFLEAAARRGLRLRTYRVPPGGRVDCTITAEDDLVVGIMQADFTGVDRVDVIAETPEGPRRVADVPLVPGARELLIAQSSPRLRALGHVRERFRLVAHEPGGERELGVYTFDHYPTPA